MIVCHQHRFIFIRSRRTAGTSLQVALDRFAGPDAIVTPILDLRDQPLLGTYLPRNHHATPTLPMATAHMSAQEAMERVGSTAWDEYLTFSVERNPWDKAVSFYFYATSREERRPGFAEWVRAFPADQLTNFPLYTIDGHVAVDRLLRYETLNDELAEVWVDLGLEQIALPTANADYRPRRSRDWRSMYDEDSAAYIAELCRNEIELLGYTFDDAAPTRPSRASRASTDSVVADEQERRHGFLTQTRPEFLYPGEPEENSLRQLERSEAFSWLPTLDHRGIGARLLRSGYLGAPATGEGWIFDHVPKTGGSEFAALADRRLYRNDHLYVRWPGSWSGILHGRLERAVLVHGHGARRAAQLQPERQWRLAMCVREPMELSVSSYQQYAHETRARGGAPLSLEQWLEQNVARFPIQDFNFQVRWLGQPEPSLGKQDGPRPAADTASGLETLTVNALSRLERCSLVGTPTTVRTLFDQIARSAALRVRADENPPPPANASPTPSRALLETLPDDLLTALVEATSQDRLLYNQACAHPGWVTCAD